METCCESLVKYFMIICNIIFALIGTVLIGFGAYAQIEAKDYLNFLGNNYVNTPIFIIILGAIIFVISFFGCCGASKESKCMMYTYGFFLFLILIAQIGSGIAAFALKGDLKDAIEVNMKTGMMSLGITMLLTLVARMVNLQDVERIRAPLWMVFIRRDVSPSFLKFSLKI